MSKRTCVICGTPVRNINPKTRTCSPECTAKLHGKPWPPRHICSNCGVIYVEDQHEECDVCFGKEMYSIRARQESGVLE